MSKALSIVIGAVIGFAAGAFITWLILRQLNQVSPATVTREDLRNAEKVLMGLRE